MKWHGAQRKQEAETLPAQSSAHVGGTKAGVDNDTVFGG